MPTSSKLVNNQKYSIALTVVAAIYFTRTIFLIPKKKKNDTGKKVKKYVNFSIMYLDIEFLYNIHLNKLAAIHYRIALNKPGNVSVETFDHIS